MTESTINAIIEETSLAPSGFSLKVRLGVPQNPLANIVDYKKEGNNISLLLESLQVDIWENVKNAPCRIKLGEGQIVAIGSFLNDTWYELIDKSEVEEDEPES